MTAKTRFSPTVFCGRSSPRRPKGKRLIIWDAADSAGFGISVTEHSRPDDIGTFRPRRPLPRQSASGAAQDWRLSGAVTLAAAREIAREWLEDIRRGVDPKVKAEEPSPTRGAEASGFLLGDI